MRETQNAPSAQVFAEAGARPAVGPALAEQLRQHTLHLCEHIYEQHPEVGFHRKSKNKGGQWRF